MTKAPSREPIRISEHAILRYLERGMGLNIEAVRQHLTDLCSAPAAIGAVCVRAEGLRFEIVHNAVTTVNPDGGLDRTSRARSQRRLIRHKEHPEALT